MGRDKIKLADEVKKFLKQSFSPKFGKLQKTFRKDPLWQKLLDVGTELWLDTGNIEEAQQHWTAEFSALTTNNTLLNKEVQSGKYDSLIKDADKLLTKYELNDTERLLEIAFILNAWHGLRLVEKFDCYVSVEEHTALAHYVGPAVYYAKRYYEICPERFIVKIPFTPAGLITTRKLWEEDVPVNHTLGFSARQNYLIARIGRPAYVNVFLGRLNSFVKENQLGDGEYVGEKATLASQRILRQLKEIDPTQSKQIGASFRGGEQVRDLAGIDVMTMPPAVAGQFKDLKLPPDSIYNMSGLDYRAGVKPDVDQQEIRLDTLWNIPCELIDCCDAFEKKCFDDMTAEELVKFFGEHKCADILVPWTDEQMRFSSKEGKIPKLENWKQLLKDKTIGLDSLMNLAGLMSFTQDQMAMDAKVKEVLRK
ncbi:MAG: transaldolase family protein [Phycisphaerae bacterium]